MDPLISLLFRESKTHYQPGELLEYEFQIDAVQAEEILAVETSVLWHSEGKGDEDLGVHFFERRAPAEADEGDLRPMRRLGTRLPNSPLSYSGTIVKIRWCLRMRVFLTHGREFWVERPFQLGSVSTVKDIGSDPQHETSSSSLSG